MGIKRTIRTLFGESNVSFFRHAGNYLSAGVVNGILAALSLAVFSRLLSPAEYGAYSIFVSIVSVFSIILELNFRGAVNRYYLEYTNDFAGFLKTALWFILAFAALCILMLAIFREPLAAIFKIAPALFVIGVVCAGLQVPWKINWKLWVAQEESAKYAKLSILRNSLVFVIGTSWIYLLARKVGVEEIGNPACVAPVGMGKGAEGDQGLLCGRHFGYVYAYLSVVAVFAVGLVIRLARLARKGRFSSGHLKYALWFGVPLMPHALSNVVLSFFDRIIINQLENQHTTGLYSFAYNIAMVMGMVVVATNQAWLPAFTNLRREGRYEAIEQLAATYSRYVYALAFLFVLFAQEIATVLGDPRYFDALPLIPVIVFGYVAVFLYTLYANHSFYLRRTWLVSLATVVAGVVNVVSNYMLIPVYGYQAAAWTTTASYFLLFALHYLFARFLLSERVVRLRKVIPWMLVLFGVSGGYLLLARQMPGYWSTLLGLKLPLLALMGAWLYWTRPKDRES